MDKFAWGAILIAVAFELLIVYYGLTNPAEELRNLYVASAFPVVLVGTVLLVYFLQRGET